MSSLDVKGSRVRSLPRPDRRRVRSTPGKPLAIKGRGARGPLDRLPQERVLDTRDVGGRQLIDVRMERSSSSPSHDGSRGPHQTVRSHHQRRAPAVRPQPVRWPPQRPEGTRRNASHADGERRIGASTPTPQIDSTNTRGSSADATRTDRTCDGANAASCRHASTASRTSCAPTASEYPRICPATLPTSADPGARRRNRHAAQPGAPPSNPPTRESASRNSRSTDVAPPASMADDRPSRSASIARPRACAPDRVPPHMVTISPRRSRAMEIRAATVLGVVRGKTIGLAPSGPSFTISR